jgi:hypothetical protein
MPYVVIILLGLSLVALGVKSSQVEKQLDGERMFWRTMYRSAEKDAKFKRCLELDDNFVICEKE